MLVSDFFPDDRTYYAGIYATHEAFSIAVIGTRNNDNYLFVDEFYNLEDSSIGLIYKALEKCQKYNLFEVKVNNLKTLNEQLCRFGVNCRIGGEEDIEDRIFRVKSMLTDGLLKIPDKRLAESFLDEVKHYNKEIISYRINALALAIHDLTPNWIAWMVSG